MCLPKYDQPIHGVLIRQPSKGYRFGVDALILAAHAISAHVRTPVLDIGTGSGVIAIILARSLKDRVVGIEVQEVLAEIARENVRTNGLADQVEIVRGDFRRYRELFGQNEFKGIVANPPFYPVTSGRVSPNESIAIAKHEKMLTLGQVLEGIRYVMHPRGTAFLIYPARAVVRLIVQVTKTGMGIRGLRFVHPEQKDAAFVVAEIIKSPQTLTGVYPPWAIPTTGNRVPREVIEVLKES